MYAGRRRLAWCSQHEGAAFNTATVRLFRTDGSDCRAVSVARAAVSRAVPAGRQDQFLRFTPRHSALYGTDGVERGRAEYRAGFLALRVSPDGQPVFRDVYELAAGRGGIDVALLADWLSDGVLHRAIESGDPEFADDGRDAAIL